jgi:uncharacterized protein
VPHPLRREDRAITDPAEIGRILSAARFATIALADAGEPYVVTLSCGYDAAHGRLCFHVAPEGRKLDIIARNPRACVTVVEDLGYKRGECAHPFRSVVMEGRMRLVSAPAEMRETMRVLIGQLEAPEDAAEVYVRNKLDDDGALTRFRMLVFEIDDMSGKEGE